MKRRHFLQTSLGAVGFLFPAAFQPATKHLILIVNCGARKKDYYENALISPNIHRIAREAFVFEQDHCERVASHDAAYMELLQGRESVAGGPPYPTILDYIGRGIQVDSILEIPRVMQQYRPRVVVCRDSSNEVGHQSYEGYLRTIKRADEAIGRVFDWVVAHPYFQYNTAIVIRPEFGRDDEVNGDGQLHHSYGFYYTHRVASIFWGPDFNKGVDPRTVIEARDMAPTLAALFGVGAIHAEGRVVPGLLRAAS